MLIKLINTRLLKFRYKHLPSRKKINNTNGKMSSSIKDGFVIQVVSRWAVTGNLSEVIPLCYS